MDIDEEGYSEENLNMLINELKSMDICSDDFKNNFSNFLTNRSAPSYTIIVTYHSF